MCQEAKEQDLGIFPNSHEQIFLHMQAQDGGLEYNFGKGEDTLAMQKTFGIT